MKRKKTTTNYNDVRLL